MSVATRVISMGHYLPQKVLHNDALPEVLQTSHQWIVERTGIYQRHIANNEETTAYMAAQAALEALKNASLNADAIDAIVVATTTPDHVFPSVAARVQHLIGAHKAFSFDVQAACSGFIYALSVVDAMIRAGNAKTVLVIGAEAMSRILDWTDRRTCVLFGDGAAAMVCQQQEVQEKLQSHILSTHLFSDGSGYDMLYVSQDVQTEYSRGGIMMNGAEVFKNAVQKMVSAIDKALAANEFSIDALDWLIPHQANARIIKSIKEHFNIDDHKVILTIDRHANTSAASIPLACYDAWASQRLKSGHTALLVGMGAGFTWGSCLLRF